MFRARHIRGEHTVDGHPGLAMAFADTGIQAATRFGGFGFSYARPIAITSAGVTLPIRDHVMAARLVVLMLTLTAYQLGGRRDR